MCIHHFKPSLTFSPSVVHCHWTVTSTVQTQRANNVTHAQAIYSKGRLLSNGRIQNGDRGLKLHPAHQLCQLQRRKHCCGIQTHCAHAHTNTSLPHQRIQSPSRKCHMLQQEIWCFLDGKIKLIHWWSRPVWNSCKHQTNTGGELFTDKCHCFLYAHITVVHLRFHPQMMSRQVMTSVIQQYCSAPEVQLWICASCVSVIVRKTNL